MHRPPADVLADALTLYADRDGVALDPAAAAGDILDQLTAWGWTLEPARGGVTVSGEWLVGVGLALQEIRLAYRLAAAQGHRAPPGAAAGPLLERLTEAMLSPHGPFAG
jgi:hypothetical protein